MGRFQPGHKKLGGKKKGTPNKATVEKNLLTRAADWINGEPYFANVKQRVERGRAPHMESYFAQRLHGRAVEQVELSGNARKPVKIVIEVVRER